MEWACGKLERTSIKPCSPSVLSTCPPLKAGQMTPRCKSLPHSTVVTWKVDKRQHAEGIPYAKPPSSLVFYSSSHQKGVSRIPNWGCTSINILADKKNLFIFCANSCIQRCQVNQNSPSREPYTPTDRLSLSWLLSCSPPSVPMLQLFLLIYIV